jgi:hypothetical protein
MEKERVTITIDPEVLHQIRKVAALESRSLSNMVERVLTEHIKNYCNVQEIKQ